ncbi:hypothetical protein A9B99_09230 [Mangrovibacter phragmitis]|uniref:DUF6933 domain-containing protein n=1 Tax=Mangrovibacter phragmitis TaxID=1691903 RepID=A0A1B7L285_9ENTR|nr:hypothetical protein [Mangrovibacter phragmitis]OAT76482.1 hypothetical protein A9B99_09230 [Mangrovibacter phragmitis]
MLVFNCTKTAAEFFTVTRQGKKQSPLEKPPTPAIIDTQHENLPVSSWLVHAIKVQRKNVLIAMHVHTRYAMVFTGLQKGNYAEFSRQWLERLFNNMQFFGKQFELCDETSFHTMVEQFIRQNPNPCFCQRGDRSVQSHISDVVWNIEYLADETGGLPEDLVQASLFDESINSTLRSTKTHKDYFHPDEEMFLEWISQYGKLDRSEEPQVREYFRALRLQMPPLLPVPEHQDEMQGITETVLRNNFEGKPARVDNVIDFQQARANKKSK